jgi:hypothetical protein
VWLFLNVREGSKPLDDGTRTAIDTRLGGLRLTFDGIAGFVVGQFAVLVETSVNPLDDFCIPC